MLLISFGVALLGARLYFMGYSPPSFSPADNPAADSDSLLTRTLTFLYLPVFNFLLLVFPVTLSFDWSMGAIPLVESLTDCRMLIIITFYSGLIWIVKYSLSYYYQLDVESQKPSLLTLSPRQKVPESNGNNSKLSNGYSHATKNGFHQTTLDGVIYRRCRKDSSSSAESVR